MQWSRRLRVLTIAGVALLAMDVLPMDLTGLRAISLVELQTRAERCATLAECDPLVARLAEVNRLEGFVLDMARRDVILIGRRVPDWPPSDIDSLVIALRHAWGRYDQAIGNTRVHTSIGVSIDPHPETILSLNEVGSALSVRGPTDEVLADWLRECSASQTARVMSIPRQTSVAKLMLDVDYELKTAASGAIALADGFPSLVQLNIDAIERARLANEPLPPIGQMSRFWFYPKPLNVLRDDGIVLIDSTLNRGFGLQILTESQHIDAQGHSSDGGPRDLVADEWVRKLSDGYAEIAETQRGWRQLDSLVWTVAIGQILHDLDAPDRAGLDLTWFLDRHPLRNVPVPIAVPGHGRVGRHEWTEPTANGYVKGLLTLPSCGGVELAVQPMYGAFAGRLLSLRVLQARPTASALFWDL